MYFWWVLRLLVKLLSTLWFRASWCPVVVGALGLPLRALRTESESTRIRSRSHDLSDLLRNLPEKLKVENPNPIEVT